MYRHVYRHVHRHVYRVNSCAQAHITVSGNVQGVYYRATTISKARDLGLTGWVRNLKNGDVEIVAELCASNSDANRGAAEMRKKIEDDFITWCWKGPEGAKEVGTTDALTKKRKVDKVAVKWSTHAESVFNSFKMRKTA